MYGLILSVHVLICFAMVLVILLQSGKGGGLAGAFGGGGTTIFGGRGATTVLTRATMILGTLFFVTSLSLALLSMQGSRGTGPSLIQQEAQRASGQQSNAPPAGSQPPATLPQSAPGAPAGTGTPASPQTPAGGGSANPTPPPSGGR
jgi:preprotein translocase subunit SecG